jgi:hypothetical protein
VRVDGNPAATFPFDARPDGPGGYKETTQHPEWGGIYQASFDVSREVPLPAGRRIIEIENAAGDWVSVLSYTFTGAVSGHYSTLRPVAIQDRATGETLLWLQDAESNWYSDREGMAPARWVGVTLSLPVPRPGAYRVEWWDTRKGQAVQAQTLTARGKSLSLKAPAFTRDIALRVTAVKKP